MRKSRNRTAIGAILVGIGVLFEIAAYREQPDLVQFSANRFYTASDLRELEVAHQTFHDLQTGRDLINQGNPSGDEQESALAQAEASNSSDRAAKIAAAEEKHTALQQKQDRAFRNQGVVSQTLKWIGIALLVSAAVFLARTGKRERAMLADAASNKVPAGPTAAGTPPR